MKLRKFLLILDPSYKARDAIHFDFQTRSLCHFVGRHLEKDKFDTKYSQIVFAAHDGNLPAIEEYFPQSLLIRVKFSLGEYRLIESSKDFSALNTYFIGLIGSGLSVLEAFEPKIAEACRRYVAAFVEGGHLNKWTDSSIRVSGKLRASLECAMTSEEFVATIALVDNSAGVISEAVVFRSKPDELLFAPKLGKLQLSGDRVGLLDKHGKRVGYLKLPP